MERLLRLNHRETSHLYTEQEQQLGLSPAALWKHKKSSMRTQWFYWFHWEPERSSSDVL